MYPPFSQWEFVTFYTRLIIRKQWIEPDKKVVEQKTVSNNHSFCSRFGDPTNASNAQIQNRYEDTTPKEHTYSNNDFEGASAPEMDYDHLASNNKRPETQVCCVNSIPFYSNPMTAFEYIDPN